MHLMESPLHMWQWRLPSPGQSHNRLLLTEYNRVTDRMAGFKILAGCVTDAISAYSCPSYHLMSGSTQGGAIRQKNSRQDGIWGIIHGQDGEGGAQDALPWK